MADKILTSDNIDYKSPFSKNRGILLVKKISVASDETFDGPRYELGTNQAAPNDIIHLSPRMDIAAYAELLALYPTIAAMTWNDKTKRAITLVTYLDVSYKIDSRAFGKKRTAEVKTATHIVATEKPTADTPGTEPNIVAATATSLAYEAAERERFAKSFAPDHEDLNAWFPRDKPQEDTVITDEMINEHELDPQKVIFAIPAHLAKSYGDRTGWHVRQIFDGALDLWLRERNQDTKQAWRLVLQYELKNPSMSSTENEDTQNALEGASSDTSGVPVQGSTSNATEAALESVEKPKQQESSQMSESPVVVYPKSDGSIVYEGVKFSVTFREGGTWAAAFPLMKEFLVHRELIARNCLEDVAQAMPSNITQMTPPVAPSAPPVSAAASAGSGTYPVVEVKKIVDEGKTRIALFSRAGDENPAGAVRRPGDIALLVAAGVNVDALQAGTRYTVNLEASWKDGNMNPKNNKPFRDIIAIRKVS